MRIAKEGWPLILSAAVLVLLALLFGWKASRRRSGRANAWRRGVFS